MEINKEQRKHVYEYMLSELNGDGPSPFLCHILESYNKLFTTNFVLIDFPEILKQKNYNSPLAHDGVWFYNSTDASGDDDMDDNFTLRISVIENALIYLNTHNGD
jgi:hypothetical protein